MRWRAAPEPADEGGAAGVARRRAARGILKGGALQGRRWGQPAPAGCPSLGSRRAGRETLQPAIVPRPTSLQGTVSPSDSTREARFGLLTLGWRAGRPNARPAAGRGPATTLRQRIFSCSAPVRSPADVRVCCNPRNCCCGGSVLGGGMLRAAALVGRGGESLPHPARFLESCHKFAHHSSNADILRHVWTSWGGPGPRASWSP